MSSKKNFTEIDFYSSGNWIFIKLKLNNTDSLNFILDSGVDETILNKRTARLLKYKFDKKASFSGAFEDDSVFYSENNTVSIGNVKLDSLIIVEVPLENQEQTFGVAIDGLIGEALFKKHIVFIDFEKEKIRLYNNDDGFIPGDSFMAIDLKIVNRLPVIESSFVISNNDTLSGRFMIDLGYRNAVAFNTPFVKKYELIAKIKKFYTLNASGILANEKTYMARIRSFKLGDISMDGIACMLVQSASGTLSVDDYDGIIGVELLNRFKYVGFDYNRKKLYLGNYSYIQDSVYSDVNCSGVELKKINKDSIIINAVYNNSPASEAGLKSGDLLTSIQGKDVYLIELTDIKKILRKKGKTIDIKVKRDARNLDIKLKLRELI
jgi:hypothetical protein